MDSTPRFDTIFKKMLLRYVWGFSIIGVILTVMHLFVVMALVELLSFNSVVANCLAFVTANIFSFYANSRWNYRTPLEMSRFWRFFAVSIAGLAITAGVTSIAAVLSWHYLIGTGAVFLALPAFTFVAHNWWTWNTLTEKVEKAAR